MRSEPPEPGYARLPSQGCLVNLAGDYDYLTHGYYVSQELELSGEQIHPTCAEVFDAYVTPLFLEKARRAGLDTPEYYLTNDWFEPPVLIDTMNPFMNRQRIVRSPAQQESAARSLTRNYTYAICCQELSDGARVRHFQAVIGWSAQPHYRNLARSVWEVFRIPIARVRVLEMEAGRILLSGMWPLRWRDVGKRERAHLERELEWLP